MKATKQFSTIYVQNWTLMRFVPFVVKEALILTEIQTILSNKKTYSWII